MLRPYRLLPIAALAVITTGCVAVTPAADRNPAEPPKTGMPQVKAAFSGGGYAKLEPLLSEDLRRRLSRERFETMAKSLSRYGEAVRIEYLTDLRHPVGGAELWKLVLVRKNDRGETIHTDKLLRVETCVLDGRRQVIGLMIQ